MDRTKLNITSYNSTGFLIAAQKYTETLLVYSDILCLQEHFLLDSRDKKHSNTDKIRIFSDKCDMMIIPAVKNNNIVTQGRGIGGLAIMWKKYLTKYVTKISSSTFRVQAMKFDNK